MSKLQQVAALPVRLTKNGKIEVLLITSRETRRWVIPKGWPSKTLSDHRMAAREAEEEAGVVGKVGAKPIGLYNYVKRLPGESVDVEVSVYLLLVRRQMSRWPERKQRKREWFAIKEAARRVDEPELRNLIAGLKQKNSAALKQG